MSKIDIQQKINSIYATRRAQNEYDFEHRLNEAKKDKKFLELYKAQKAASLKKLDNKNEETIKAYTLASKNLYDYIINKKIDLNNYYECNDCRDTGTINGKMCHCKKRLFYKMLREEANLPVFATNTFENSPFENLNVKQSQGMAKLAHTLQAWAKKTTGFNRCVAFINGGVGIGKTTLAFCVANEALNNLCSVYYASAYDFAKMLIDKQFNRLNNEDAYYNMLDSDLLIIDDLGTESTNVLAVEQLFAIVDSRINNNKKTMICSNLTHKQFSKRYGERSLSRLTSKAYSIRLEYITGDDIRTIKC